MIELGEVQQKILRHFFDCKDKEPESVSHISMKLGLLQPSVYRSVDLLIKEKYLIKEGQYTHGEKELIVTEKGAAAAVLLGITNDHLIDYFRKLKRKYSSPSDEIQNLQHLIDDEVQFFQHFKQMIIGKPDKQDLLIRKMMEYFLKNNYFDESGNAKRLSPDEFKMLLTYVAIAYHNALGNPRTIRDLVDKYSLDRKQLKTILEKEKLRIDSIIRQLED
jgi:hypothetical protein